MVKSAENWFGDNAMAGTNLMAIGRRCEAIGRRIRNAGPEAGVRTRAIVMRDLLPEHSPHVALVQQNHEIEALTPDCADQSLAEGIRLRRPGGRLEGRQPHCRNRAIDTLGVNGVAVVHDKIAVVDHPTPPSGTAVPSTPPLDGPSRSTAGSGACPPPGPRRCRGCGTSPSPSRRSRRRAPIARDCARRRSMPESLACSWLRGPNPCAAAQFAAIPESQASRTVPTQSVPGPTRDSRSTAAGRRAIAVGHVASISTARTAGILFDATG